MKFVFRKNKDRKENTKTIAPRLPGDEEITLFWDSPALNKKVERIFKKFLLPVMILTLGGVFGLHVITYYIPRLIDTFSYEEDTALVTEDVVPKTVIGAEIAEVEGEVSKRNGGINTRLNENVRVFAGETVYMGDNSSLGLKFPDGTLMEFSSGADIYIDSINNSLYKLELDRGNVRVTAVPSESRKVYIDMSGLIFETYGGDFDITNEGEVGVFVKSGSIKLTDKVENEFQIGSMQMWYESSKEIESIILEEVEESTEVDNLEEE